MPKKKEKLAGKEVSTKETLTTEEANRQLKRAVDENGHPRKRPGRRGGKKS